MFSVTLVPNSIVLTLPQLICSLLFVSSARLIKYKKLNDGERSMYKRRVYLAQSRYNPTTQQTTGLTSIAFKMTWRIVFTSFLIIIRQSCFVRVFLWYRSKVILDNINKTCVFEFVFVTKYLPQYKHNLKCAYMAWTKYTNQIKC